MSRRIITKEKFEDLFSLANNFGNSTPLIFKRRIFNFEVIINPFHRNLVFQDCEFSETVRFKRGVPLVVDSDDNENRDFSEFKETNEFKNNITFKDKCIFRNTFILKNIKIKGKFRLHNSKVEAIDFENTEFNDLADFWKTTFAKPIIFLKTDFNATAVFSMATFNDNVLFTYSLFAGKAIFSRTIFQKGLDLSQAIISGNLKLFDLKIKYSDYESPYFHLDNDKYQSAIDNESIIPLVNKQETFRLLKHYAQSNGDGFMASRYKVYEYRSHNKLIWQQLKHRHRWISHLSNIPMMFFNRISNNYGSNYWLGALFTILVAILFLNKMLTISGGFEYTCDYSKWQWDKLAILLNPVHRIKDLNLELEKSIYVLDFLSRIAVGYGIYQTVQAFRKFK